VNRYEKFPLLAPQRERILASAKQLDMLLLRKRVAITLVRMKFLAVIDFLNIISSSERNRLYSKTPPKSIILPARKLNNYYAF
jgi:hypothetical protein